VLIDSDVLVWITRGHPGAIDRLRQLSAWRISVVTYIELAQGCRNKAELERLKKGFSQQGTPILPLTEAISTRAMQLIDQHTLASGLQLGDALIAATALEHQLPLLTGNTKHFAPIAELNIETFLPR
jgi:hypothetical protein